MIWDFQQDKDKKMGESKISLPGMLVTEIECFERYIRQIPDGQCYIEIGIYAGGTLCAAALATKENKNTLVFGIDPLVPDQLGKRAAHYNQPTHPLINLHNSINLLPTGCAQRIRLIPTMSSDLIRDEEFRKQVEGRVGFLLVDGDHMKGIYEDAAYLDLMPLGATVVFHDYIPGMFPGICTVVDRLIEFGTIEMIEKVDSLVIAKKVKTEIPTIAIPPDVEHHKWGGA